MFCKQCGTDNTESNLFCKKCGTRLEMGQSQALAQADEYSPYASPRSNIVQNQGGNEGFRGYGGFWLRTCAYVLDSFILCAIFFVLFMLLGGVVTMDEGFRAGVSPNRRLSMIVGFIAIFLVLLGPWLYWALSESSSWQATLGKKALGLKVVDADGQRIGFWRASGRFFAKIISSVPFGIGFFMVGFMDKKQGLHDVIASTYVVRD